MVEDRELLCQAWLSCSDSLGIRARQALKQLSPSAASLFEFFPPEVLDIAGAKAYQELAALRDKGLDKLREALRRADIRLSMPGDGIFPEPLLQLDDAPELLFYRGSLKAQEARSIAMVGSRRETRYGREQAFAIARDLAARGVTIISGLARGIDTAAHLGALEAGGQTIAILGSGLKNIYPGENKALAERIVHAGGAIISEFAPTAEPLAYRFPIRNRLVSGLSQGVLLVEAREKSGTLITVGHALRQGREVFALPGQVDAPGSAVPHRLLREGAGLVTCAEDLMADMGWDTPQRLEQTGMNLPDLTNDQKRLYDALCLEPLDFGELTDQLRLPAQQLNVLLTTLEMEGLIEALPGRRFRALKR